MKKTTTICLLLFLFSIHAFTQQTKVKWEVKNPFEHDVFIENKGQFKENIESEIKQPVLYYSIKGSTFLFFSRNSVTFISNKMENKDVSEKGNDRDKKSKLTHEAMGITWDGANPNAYVVAENEVTDYFTYPDTTSKNKLPGILAHAWRKLTYHNLYAGIDVEFNYPEKGGLEMNIIVHPGADISKVKMHYNGAKTLLKSNDIYISSDCTDFLAHAPVTKDENNNAVKSSISLNSGNISFKTNTYNNHKALTLSNWFSGTSFTGLNSAFDIGYDVSGNVYVFGGGSSTEYQLQKYNSSGTLQWTYTPSTWPEGGGFNYYYGDLVTDTRNGDCYINAGTGGGYSTAGAQINKVSPSGILLKNFPGDTKEQEMWRMDLDYCHNLLVIAAGDAGSPPYQAYTIDTGFVAGTPVNVLGTDSAFHDMALLALDQTGHAYMATSKSAGGASSYIADNVMLSVPIPALAPTAYQVSDGYSFVELSSISYYGSVFGGYPANGMNGLVANSHMVVSYDGATVKKWTTTGTLKKSLGLPGGTSFTQGGLDLDCQGNIYAGNGSSIDVYDSTLTTLIGSIPVTNTVYDLKVTGNGLVYACGKSFVGAYSVASKMVTVSSIPPTTCSSCDGQVTANVSCGSGNYTYQWSNGATTSTITGLCQGSYSVTVTDASTCAGAGREDTASVKLALPGGPTINISSKTEPLCYGASNGSATASVSGGTGPYTYSWSPNGGTNATATNLSEGIYTVTVTNGNGCTSIDSVMISQPAQINVGTNISPACSGNNGNATAIVSDGIKPYTYAWAPFGGTNATATGLAAGTYTVTVKDSNECSQTQTATVSVATGSGPTLTQSLTSSSCSICNGAASISASGGTAPFTYAWSNGATSSSLSNLCSGIYTVSVISAGDSALVPFYTEDFSNGGTGWILNIPGPGTNGTHTNTWVIDNSTPLCNPGNYLHVACSGSNTFYTCIPGATYDPGTPSFDNSATDLYVSSPNISTIGKNKMILSFTYQCEGYTGTDYGMVSFSSNGGSTWNDLPTQYYNTSSCTKASITVPAVYNGISNFRIGFRWVNGTSGNGNNPPFAINNISLGSFSMVLGCSTEDSVQIKVDSLPGVKLSASTNPICIGDTSTLRISGGTSYQWNTGSTASSINVSPSVTTTYTVYVNDGTCSGDTSITVTVNTCTGIQEIYSNSSVAIYPNPNNGAFTVSIQTLTGKPTTEIFNVFGQLIYTETLIKADTEVDLRMQPKGIYFCRIVDENGAELYSSKLIVQ